jgi:hypothetical protein
MHHLRSNEHSSSRWLFFWPISDHPSLRAKKYDTERWQARVTRDWRFYFRIEGDSYILLDIMRHPK